MAFIMAIFAAVNSFAFTGSTRRGRNKRLIDYKTPGHGVAFRTFGVNFLSRREWETFYRAALRAYPYVVVYGIEPFFQILSGIEHLVVFLLGKFIHLMAARIAADALIPIIIAEYQGKEGEN